MPRIEQLEGIKINIYYGDHLPPHIHAEYGNDEVLLIIETGEIYEDWLPTKQLRKSKKWLLNNKSDAARLFRYLNPHLYASRKIKTKNTQRKKS